MRFTEDEKINDFDGVNYKQFINLKWQFMTIYKYNKHLRWKNDSSLIIDIIEVRFMISKEFMKIWNFVVLRNIRRGWSSAVFNFKILLHFEFLICCFYSIIPRIKNTIT